MSNKNEVAKNIASNIKAKISEFRAKKSQEKTERKEALDIEINKDFMNKFKKNNNDGQTSENIKRLMNPSGNMDEFTIQKVDKQPISNNQNYSNKNLNLSMDAPNPNASKQKFNLGNLNNLLNQDRNIKESVSSNRLNILNLNKKDNLNISHNEGRPPISSSKFQAKELDSIEQQLKAFKNNIGGDRYKRATSSDGRNLVSGGLLKFQSTPKPENQTKNKIQKFMFQMEDENKRPKKENKPTILNYMNQNNQYIPSYKPPTPQLQRFENPMGNPLFFNSNKEMDDFADFSIKTNKQIRGMPSLFEFDLTSNTSKNILSGPFSGNLRAGKKESSSGLISGADKLNVNEIRSLNNKIRFLNQKDISEMDKRTVDELLSLANNIKLVFGN